MDSDEMNMSSGDYNATLSNGTSAPMSYKNYTVRMVFVVAMIVFSIAGFFGNFLIVLTIVMVRSLRSTRNAFLANLAVSDIVLIVIVVPFNVVSVLRGPPFWADRYDLCMFVASICTPGCLSAIWSITGVAFNRYFFICRSESYEKYFSPIKSMLWILALWALSFAIHAPNHLGWGHSRYAEKFYLCTRETKLVAYSIFYSSVGIVLPLAISFVSYYRIYALVRTTTSARNKILGTAKRNQAEVVPVVASEPTQPALDALPGKSPIATLSTPGKVQAEFRLVKTLFRSFAVFLLAWLPMALLLMWPNLEAPAWVYLMVVFLAHGSTATNSVLYFATNEEFRRGFHTTVLRLTHKYARGDDSAGAANSVGRQSSRRGMGTRNTDIDKSANSASKGESIVNIPPAKRESLSVAPCVINV